MTARARGWGRLRAPLRPLRRRLLDATTRGLEILVGPDGGNRVLVLDYPFDPRPRYGFERPPHPELQGIIDSGRDRYARQLRSFAPLRPFLERIAAGPGGADDTEPVWDNGWLPGLDALTLYGLLAERNPRTYVEIGSGNSTKFARRAISDHGLGTSVVSIDPTPRSSIDALCDRVVREPLETADLTLFAELGAGDVVFFDGTHRALPGSDVTVFFLELLPRLAPGVLVQLHDVFLPWDYPPVFARVAFSEQYLLAAHLLSGGGDVSIVMPAWYVSQDAELTAELRPLQPALPETHGVSFWFET